MAKQVRSWRRVQTCERGKTRTRLVYACQVLWYQVCKDRPVLLVICRDPEGKEKDDFFFTTDLSLAPETVVSEYANRWGIEDTFRNLKQVLGTEEPQCWQGEGPHKAIAMGCFLYGFTWLTYILHGHAREPIQTTPWYADKATPSFHDAIAWLRKEIWHHRFSLTSGRKADLQEFCDALICALARAA
jgi:hypothetical protein